MSDLSIRLREIVVSTDREKKKQQQQKQKKKNFKIISSLFLCNQKKNTFKLRGENQIIIFKRNFDEGRNNY